MSKQTKSRTNACLRCDRDRDRSRREVCSSTVRTTSYQEKRAGAKTHRHVIRWNNFEEEERKRKLGSKRSHNVISLQGSRHETLEKDSRRTRHSSPSLFSCLFPFFILLCKPFVDNFVIVIQIRIRLRDNMSLL